MKYFLPALFALASCHLAPKPDSKPIDVPVKRNEPNISPVQYINKKLIDLKVDPEKTVGMAGVELWYSVDEGQSWQNHGKTDGKPESVSFTAAKDARYSFVFVPYDRAGERQFTPKPETQPDYIIVVDTISPVVEVKSPNGGELLGAGQSTQITWVGADKNISYDSVLIEVSPTGGDNWITLVKNHPNTGKYFWDIPRSSSQKYKIRIKVQDLAGNTGIDESDDLFTIDGLTPEAEIIGPTIFKSLPAKIEFKATDFGGAGVASVKLYHTRDKGQTWHLLKETMDLTSPIEMRELDGVYGVKLVAVDKVGNSTHTPISGTKAQREIIIDTTSPIIKLISPKHTVFMTSSEIDIMWTAKDNLQLIQNSLSIEYSEDGIIWNLIAKDHEVATNHYRWKAPGSAGMGYKLRVRVKDIVGNTGEDHFGPFTVDSLVPEAVATGPRASNTQTMEITYEVKNKGYADINKVTLYYSIDGGKTWTEYGDDPDHKSPFIFTKPDGEYGIYITCQTEAGTRAKLCQKRPESGTSPQLQLTLDSTRPDVRLLTFNNGGYFKIPSSHKITWSYNDKHPVDDGMTIDYSPDGGRTWYLIEKGINPQKGEYPWELPAKKEGELYLLRLTSRDKFGNEEKVLSARPFKLDNDLPTLRLIATPDKVIRFRDVRIGYVAKDLTSGVQRVMAYIKRMDKVGKYEKITDDPNVTGEAVIKFPDDGHWGVKLISQDFVGSESDDIIKDPAPDVQIKVDTRKPSVGIKSFLNKDGQMVYVNKSFEVEWEASDETTSPLELAMRLEYSYNNGKEWLVAVAKTGNSGKYPFETWLIAGRKVMIRIVASDEAGNEGTSTSGEFEVDVLNRPSITLTGLKEAEEIEAGSLIELIVTSEGILKSLQLEEKGPMTDWHKVVAVENKQVKYKAQDKPGIYSIRVTGIDPISRVIPSHTITFKTKLPPLPQLGIEIIPNRIEHQPGAEITFSLISKEKLTEPWLQLKVTPTEWQNVALFVRNQVRYKLPIKEGDFSFRIYAKDKYERSVESDKEIFVRIILTTVPRIKMILSGFKDGDKLQAKTQAIIHWVPAEALQLISEMHLQAFDGESWKSIEKVAATEIRFTVPEREGDYILRLWGKDKKGNEIMSEDQVKIRVIAPRIPVILGIDKKIHAPEEELSLQIVSKPPLFDPKKASLEITKFPYEVWRTIPAKITDESIKFNAPAEYGLHSVRLKYEADKMWLYSDPLTFDVKSKMASLRLKNFKGGESIPGGKGRMIFIEHRDIDISRIRIALSDKSGEDGSYKEISQDQLTFSSNGILWKVPQVTGKTFRLRISYESIVDSSSGDFIIDSVSPQVKATGPASQQDKTPIEIEFTDKQSISKIKDILLFVSNDDGKNWNQENIFPYGKKVLFSPQNFGEYGIYLAVRSEANLESSLPIKGTNPQITIKYITVKPPTGDLKLEVSAGTKEKMKGGEKVKVKWHGSPEKATVTLYVFADDKIYSRLKSDLKPSGETEIELPSMNAKKAQIRALIELDGKTGWVASNYFEIDSKPPDIIDEQIVPEGQN